jgi:DNA-binding GntR family transcriptional regulator
MNPSAVDSMASTAPHDAAWPDASPPRYQQVGAVLAREIGEGLHPVGSLLPPEPQLCARFGVSRHTLREAVRRLCDQGLLQRRQGVGTVVRAERPPSAPRYLAALGSLQELMQYTQQTRLVCLNWHDRQADEALAAELRCEVGESWLEIQACRYPVLPMAGSVVVDAAMPPTGSAALPSTDLPLVHMRVYVRPQARGVLDDLGRGDAWFFGLIERHGGQRIVEAEQVVGAIAIPAPVARVLGVRSRSPGLRVLRRYLGTEGRLLSVSINTHPAERFELATRWRLASREGGAGR